MKSGEEGENRQIIHPENPGFILFLKLFFQLSFACRYFPLNLPCAYIIVQFSALFYFTYNFLAMLLERL